MMPTRGLARMLMTYQNPVWPGCMADPFVLKWQGKYYAYGTGPTWDLEAVEMPGRDRARL